MSCLRAIGQFVSEFARFILFFASIIFLLSSSLLLWFSIQSRKDFSFVHMDNIQTALSVALGLSAYLIILAIIGVFASFYSNKSTIKLLAFMTTLNVIVCIAVLASSSPKLDSLHEDLLVKLKDIQRHYDWEHKADQPNKEIANATLAWDSIQADLHCCGLEGPADWATFKPPVHKDQNILPISCCQSYAESSKNKSTHGKDDQSGNNHPKPGEYCDAAKSSAWSKGCIDEMETTFSLIMDMVIFVVSFSLVVGLLSGIVLCCRPSEPSPRSYMGGNFH